MLFSVINRLSIPAQRTVKKAVIRIAIIVENPDLFCIRYFLLKKNIKENLYFFVNLFTNSCFNEHMSIFYDITTHSSLFFYSKRENYGCFSFFRET